MNTIPDRPGTRATLLLLLLALCLCFMFGLRHLIGPPRSGTFSVPPNYKEATKPSPKPVETSSTNLDVLTSSYVRRSAKNPNTFFSPPPFSAPGQFSGGSDPLRSPPYTAAHTASGSSSKIATVDLQRILALRVPADTSTADRKSILLEIQQACTNVAVANQVSLLLDRSAISYQQSPFIYSETGAADLTDQVLKELNLNHTLTQAK